MGMQIVADPTNWVNGRGYRKHLLAEESVLACPGALVQIVEMAPGDLIPDHVHEHTTEFYTVLEGACRLVVNEEETHLSAGEMFLIKPGDVHRLYNPEGRPFRLLVFKTNSSSNDIYWE